MQSAGFEVDLDSEDAGSEDDEDDSASQGLGSFRDRQPSSAQEASEVGSLFQHSDSLTPSLAKQTITNSWLQQRQDQLPSSELLLELGSSRPPQLDAALCLESEWSDVLHSSNETSPNSSAILSSSQASPNFLPVEVVVVAPSPAAVPKPDPPSESPVPPDYAQADEKKEVALGRRPRSAPQLAPHLRPLSTVLVEQLSKATARRLSCGDPLATPFPLVPLPEQFAVHTARGKRRNSKPVDEGPPLLIISAGSENKNFFSEQLPVSRLDENNKDNSAAAFDTDEPPAVPETADDREHCSVEHLPASCLSATEVHSAKTSPRLPPLQPQRTLNSGSRLPPRDRSVPITSADFAAPPAAVRLPGGSIGKCARFVSNGGQGPQLAADSPGPIYCYASGPLGRLKAAPTFSHQSRPELYPKPPKGPDCGAYQPLLPSRGGLKLSFTTGRRFRAGTRSSTPAPGHRNKEEKFTCQPQDERLMLTAHLRNVLGKFAKAPRGIHDSNPNLGPGSFNPRITMTHIQPPAHAFPRTPRSGLVLGDRDFVPGPGAHDPQLVTKRSPIAWIAPPD